jgi:hypothetical protein
MRLETGKHLIARVLEPTPLFKDKIMNDVYSLHNKSLSAWFHFIGWHPENMLFTFTFV